MNKNLEKCKKLMEIVYGKYTQNWKPKPYADNKSRYLWTDAYGLCNFLSLYLETKESHFLEQAKLLMEDVHNTLGKDRSLKKRLGNSTDDHPLLGGLRIGKQHEEGHPDGDGQYFHYLTKWMFALNRLSLATKDDKYNNWAIELAESIHDHFVYNKESNRPRMYWKISIDMKRPLVPSEGNLDPFDGYVTYRLLQEYAKRDVLKRQIKDLEKIVMLKYKYYDSNDPLDLGESLWICHWYKEEEWAKHVSQTALNAIEELWDTGYFRMSRNYRLAFREFGTTIGVQMYPEILSKWTSRVNALHDFWDPFVFARDADISPVMYATSLLPGVIKRDGINH